MKGNQPDGTCSRIGEKRQDIGWKDGTKRTFGRPRSRWQNKIKIKEVEWKGCTEVTWLGKGASGRLL
jgi:hypothetical protein